MSLEGGVPAGKSRTVRTHRDKAEREECEGSRNRGLTAPGLSRTRPVGYTVGSPGRLRDGIGNRPRKSQANRFPWRAIVAASHVQPLDGQGA